MSKTPREQLEKLVAEMKTVAEDLDGKGVAASAEDRETLTKMGTEVGELIATIKTNAAASGTLDVASAFLGELAGTGHGGKSIVIPGEVDPASGIVNPNGMTLGEAFAKSPAYQEFATRMTGSNGAIMSVPIQKAANYEAKSLYGVNTKTLITGLSDTSAGAFVTTQRLNVVSDLIGERRLYVRDLCTNINIPGKDTFDYVTVTGKTNAAAPVLEATTSATPGLNNVAVGAYTAAHGVKPESELLFAVVTSIVETIAHMIPISRRAAADGGQVMQMVNEFLLYGLREEEEDQFLNGNGTTPNLQGIVPVVGNTAGSAGTDIDAVVEGIRLIRVDNREPTALVVNGLDWYSTGFLLAKDSAGNYILGDPRASIDQLNTIWGLRVVVTPAMTENTLLIGDFRQAVVADSQRSAIYMTDSHNDHFARNILDILAEERIGFGILDRDAFATITAV